MEDRKSSKNNARLIAFYLPQYHPIPENDEWWGDGFTEWTNVQKAQPFFEGHYQPHTPADLGYYHLLDHSVRVAQADLARKNGIEGFCYWHYWFAGRRLLEKPFDEVLESGKPNFPFCLAWANNSWTGIWHGSPGRMLIKQTYPGFQDEQDHFYMLLDAFRDARYLKVDGKPIFYIYKPRAIPNLGGFIKHWNDLASKEGLVGIHFIANIESSDTTFEEGAGFSAVTPHNPGWTLYNNLNLTRKPSYVINRILLKFTDRSLKDRFQSLSRPYVFGYREYIMNALPAMETHLDVYPCIVPNWDNTPRCGINGVVLAGSTPELFAEHMCAGLEQVANLPNGRNIMFIKSWNEWAEGNYLEPDTFFGRRYLEVCKNIVCG